MWRQRVLRLATILDAVKLLMIQHSENFFMIFFRIFELLWWSCYLFKDRKLQEQRNTQLKYLQRVSYTNVVAKTNRKQMVKGLKKREHKENSMLLEACTIRNVAHQGNLIAIWKMSLHPCPSHSVTEEFWEGAAVSATIINKALLKLCNWKKIPIVFLQEKAKW